MKDWKERGACFDTGGTLFFPIRAEMSNDEYNEQVEKAKAICAGCVVQPECAEKGQEMDYGIWGGIVR